MAERSLFIYIAAVLTITFLPIYSQDDLQSESGLLICKNEDFKPIGGACYGILPGERNWTKAKDTCDRLNGELATFTSLYEMKNVLKALVLHDNGIFVGTPREAAETDHFWTGTYQSEEDTITYLFRPEMCINFLAEDKYLCKEIDKDNTAIEYPPVMTSSSPSPIEKETCSYPDSILVDGECYRLSESSFTWSEAKEYCESWNGKMATIYTVEQGKKVLSNFNNTSIYVWAITDPFNNDNNTFVWMESDGIEGPCYAYVFGRAFGDLKEQVLCIE